MIEVIAGKVNRDLTEDQWKLVLAVKDNKGKDVWDTFQTYWKERCDNTHLLSDFDSWIVLEEYARKMFNQAEWYHVRQKMYDAFFNRKTLSARDVAEIYLLAIYLMQVRYSMDEGRF